MAGEIAPPTMMPPGNHQQYLNSTQQSFVSNTPRLTWHFTKCNRQGCWWEASEGFHCCTTHFDQLVCVSPRAVGLYTPSDASGRTGFHPFSTCQSVLEQGTEPQTHRRFVNGWMRHLHFVLRGRIVQSIYCISLRSEKRQLVTPCELERTHGSLHRP